MHKIVFKLLRNKDGEGWHGLQMTNLQKFREKLFKMCELWYNAFKNLFETINSHKFLVIPSIHWPCDSFSGALLVKRNVRPVLLGSSVVEQELKHFQVTYLETVTLDTSVCWVWTHHAPVGISQEWGVFVLLVLTVLRKHQIPLAVPVAHFQMWLC